MLMFTENHSAENIIDCDRNINFEISALFIALRKINESKGADGIFKERIAKDKFDRLLRFLLGYNGYYDIMDSKAIKICFDMVLIC